MAIKLGNTDINSNIALNKAYLGNNLVLGALSYLLSFDKSTRDMVQLPYSAFPVNDLVGQDFYYEVKLRIRETAPTNDSGAIGNMGVGVDSNNRMGWLFGTTSIVLFFGGSARVLTGFPSDFYNELVTLRIDATNNGGTTDIQPTVNGKNYGGVLTLNSLQIGSEQFSFINNYGNSNNGGAGNSANVDIEYVDLNGLKFNLNEGSGFLVSNTDAQTGNGVTTNAGQLSYWNSNVWKISTEDGKSIYDSSKWINSILYVGGERSAFSKYSFNTDSDFVRVEVDNTLYPSFSSYSNYAIYVDGVFDGVKSCAVTDTYYYYDLPSGNHDIDIIQNITTIRMGSIVSTFITDIKIDDTVFTQYEEQPTTDKVVFVGDSITVGDGSLIPQNEAFSRLFEVENSHEVGVIGYGSAKVESFTSTPTELAEFRTNIIDMTSNITSNKKVVIALGTNDFGLSGTPVNTFEGWYIDLVEEVNSIDANIEIYCISPLFRTDESQLLVDYRTAIDNICSTRAYCTYIDGGVILNAGDLADGVHPTTAGHKKYKDAIYSVII